MATLPPVSTLHGWPEPKTPRAVEPLGLNPDEAAIALGISRDFFDEHVLPELKIVRRGRKRIIPVAELNRWLEAQASRVRAA